MDFEYTCIYNPDYGTEENVDPQIVYHSAANTDYIKLIGVAQGIAELSYSFGGSSVKWFKTGRKHQAKLILVVSLYRYNDQADWRSGFWFAGQLPSSAETLLPEICHRLVKLTFDQQMLEFGPPPEGSNTEESDQYWSAFVARSFTASMPAVLTPTSLRLAPGRLNPSTRTEIEQTRDENGVLDILITTVEDGSAVYEGEVLNIETRIAIQRWLEQNFPGRSTPKQLSHEDVNTNHNDADSSANEDASSAVDDTSSSAAVDSSAVNLSAEQPKDEDTVQQTKSSSSWFSSSSSYIPTMKSFTSVRLPSMQWVPPLESMTLTPISDWWNARSEEPSATTTDGFLVSGLKLHEMSEDHKPIYITIWRHMLYSFTVITRESHALPSTALFESLSARLEGFNFAFEPPTRFYYYIEDPRKQTVVSTFPASSSASNEVMRSLVEMPERTQQQVVRLGSTWLYSVCLENGGVAIFGKKNVTSQQMTLLGALHSDVQQWLDQYNRKYC